MSERTALAQAQQSPRKVRWTIALDFDGARSTA